MFFRVNTSLRFTLRMNLMKQMKAIIIAPIAARLANSRHNRLVRENESRFLLVKVISLVKKKSREKSASISANISTHKMLMYFFIVLIV
jgi:hypothetical protein